MHSHDTQATLTSTGLAILTPDETAYRQLLEKMDALGCGFMLANERLKDSTYDANFSAVLVSPSGTLYLLLPDDLRDSPTIPAISLADFLSLDLDSFAEQAAERQANKKRVSQARALKEQLHQALYEREVKVDQAVLDALELALTALKKASA